MKIYTAPMAGTTDYSFRKIQARFFVYRNGKC